MWYWNQVAFDGEDRASAAEHAGGPEPQLSPFDVNQVDPLVLQQVAAAHNRQLAIQEGQVGLTAARQDEIRRQFAQMEDIMRRAEERHRLINARNLAARIAAADAQAAQMTTTQIMDEINFAAQAAQAAQSALRPQRMTREITGNPDWPEWRHPAQPPPRRRRRTEAIDLTGDDDQTGVRRSTGQLRPAGTDAQRRRQETIDLTREEEED